MSDTPKAWKVGTDIFGAVHVFDEDGDRLTNDRMNGPEGWKDIAHLIAAAPDMLEALKELADEAIRIGDMLSAKGQGATVLGMKTKKARAAIAKATGET